MGRVAGKVAFITGAARGQGRSHAVRLAEEGADIIAVDICADIETVPYPMASADDLAETARLVEKHGRRVVTCAADVRDQKALSEAVAEGLRQLGRLDIVCANAGVLSFGTTHELTEQAWKDVLDIDLTGVWHTCKATIPHLIAGGSGGSIIVTSSTSGLKGTANLGHYSAAKHGVVGLMHTMAKELAPHFIRVNSVHPTIVPTAMMVNEAMYRIWRPDLETPGLDDVRDLYVQHNLLDVPWVEERDVSNAVLFLASDEARYITSSEFVIDAGQTQK
jgi:SDR family mycofactocin-dependent oxidoreductase